AALEQVMALDVADEIQVQLRAEPCGLAREGGAFALFGAVAQDPYARSGMIEQFARIDAAHHGELRQAQRFALGVRAAVQKEAVAHLAGWHNARNGRPLDPFKAP